MDVRMSEQAEQLKKRTFHFGVCKSRSHADFISKIGIVLEEADESAFWLELLVSTSIVAESAVMAHRAEARRTKSPRFTSGNANDMSAFSIDDRQSMRQSSIKNMAMHLRHFHEL